MPRDQAREPPPVNPYWRAFFAKAREIAERLDRDAAAGAPAAEPPPPAARP